jgi:hypothetical protein
MYIGKWLLVRYENKIIKGIVTKIFQEDLDIRLEDDTIIRRKFWEVRIAPYDNEKEEK